MPQALSAKSAMHRWEILRYRKFLVAQFALTTELSHAFMSSAKKEA